MDKQVIRNNEYIECQYCGDEIREMSNVNLCRSRSGFCRDRKLIYERCSRIVCIKCIHCSYCSERIRTYKLKVDKSRQDITYDGKKEYREYTDKLKSEYDVTYQ